MSARRRQAGATLVEILVYSSLMLVLFAAVYGMFIAGRRYYEIARSSILVQQAANSAGYAVTRDLMETDASTIQFYPNSGNASAPPGVVFLSARDTSGQFQLDSTFGIPNWQKYVGYYLDTDPESSSTDVRALFRAEMAPGGLPSVNPGPGSTRGVTTATLKSSGANKRIVAHGVRAPGSTSPHGGFDVYVMSGSSKSYDSTGNLVFIELELYDDRAGVASGSAQRRINSVRTEIRVEVRD